ncbi:MAG: hypothetical protein ACR2N2_00500 [Acidimicrobiia bacterium]
MPPDDIDQILTETKRISSRLQGNLDDATRTRLETERETLRSQARDLAAQRRHPASVDAEIEMLELRRAEIEELLIGKGYAEKWMKQTIQDPGAYSHNINKQIEAEHSVELAEISDRLAELRPLVAKESADGDAASEESGSSS